MSDGPVGWIKAHKQVAVGAAAVLVVVGWIAYRRAGANKTPQSGAASNTTGALTSGGGEYLVPYAGDSMTSDNLLAALNRLTTPDGPTTLTGGVNNLSWTQQAVAWLAGAGFDPLGAQSAIQRYLSGGTLTSAEAAEVGQAVKQLGLPPAGTPEPRIGSTTPTAYPPRIPLGFRPPPTGYRPFQYPVLHTLSRVGTIQSLTPPPGGWPIATATPILGSNPYAPAR